MSDNTKPVYLLAKRYGKSALINMNEVMDFTEKNTSSTLVRYRNKEALVIDGCVDSVLTDIIATGYVGLVG